MRPLRRKPRAREDRRLAAALLVVIGTAGCQGCRDDHPYVPYAIAATDASAGRVAPDAGVATARRDDRRGRERAVRRTIGDRRPRPGRPAGRSGGVVLQAPEGQVFVSAAVRDFDGDGAADAFALVRPAQGNDPGALVYYRGVPAAAADEALAPQDIVTPPATLVRDGACPAVARLVVAGKRSAFVELGRPCAARPTSAPDRWVAVVAAGTPARVRLAATIVDPPTAPALSIDGDASDRDHDGLEDVALRVTLEGGSAPLEPGPRVSATIAWLDRPAGLSRDAGVTEASFASLAGLAAAHAKGAKDAAGVAALVAQTRALWRAVCADGGAPRLAGVAGTGTITCGATRALEDAGLAEVRAWATLGDGLRAALALDRAERSPASRTAARAAEARGWIEQAAPSAKARSIRGLAAGPVVPRGHEPSWGSLAFEPSGKLLVRTRAGVVRVDPATGEGAAADGAGAWKPAVTSPDGAARWIEAYDACDGVALRATFEAGDDVKDVGLPVAPPLGVRCAGSRGAPATALPIAWGPAGLEAIVDGVPVLVASDLSRASTLAGPLASPVAPGGPRSPDGKTLVVPASSGLVVRGAARARRVGAPARDGTYAEQRDCTVSDDGTRVACVHAGRAWVGAWDAP